LGFTSFTCNLPEADRAMVVDVVQKIAERLKDRL
jgi:hypothetical protein